MREAKIKMHFHQAKESSLNKVCQQSIIFKFMEGCYTEPRQVPITLLFPDLHVANNQSLTNYFRLPSEKNCGFKLRDSSVRSCSFHIYQNMAFSLKK